MTRAIGNVFLMIVFAVEFGILFLLPLAAGRLAQKKGRSRFLWATLVFFVPMLCFVWWFYATTLLRIKTGAIWAIFGILGALLPGPICFAILSKLKSLRLASRNEPTTRSSRRLKYFSVVVIITLILATTYSIWPRVGNRVIAQHDAGNTLGALGHVSSAIAIYREDHAGQYPNRLEDLIPKYLQSVPAVKITFPEAWAGTGSHPLSSRVQYASSTQADDTGGWIYVNDPTSPDVGKVIVNCTHTDFRGRPWNQESGQP